MCLIFSPSWFCAVQYKRRRIDSSVPGDVENSGGKHSLMKPEISPAGRHLVREIVTVSKETAKLTPSDASKALFSLGQKLVELCGRKCSRCSSWKVRTLRIQDE
jgi:hypothetical protein